MNSEGTLRSEIKDGRGTITFSHPKGNSLPAHLLNGLAETVNQLGSNQEVAVVLLQSEGSGAFCAGASFTELQAIKNKDQGKEFFMGFARLILAMKQCPKIIVSRVQGKVVGGGVGMVAASDYALAVNSASIKLSELALGIGPFVVGPAVERKIGTAAFNVMAIDTEWKDAAWALQKGLYAENYDTIEELDEAVSALTSKLCNTSLGAMSELKKAMWHGTEDWNVLLENRAEISGRLVTGEISQRIISGAGK